MFLKSAIIFLDFLTFCERSVSLHQTSSFITSSFAGLIIAAGDEPNDCAVFSKHDDVAAVIFSETGVGEHCVKQKNKKA